MISYEKIGNKHRQWPNKHIILNPLIPGLGSATEHKPSSDIEPSNQQ